MKKDMLELHVQQRALNDLNNSFERVKQYLFDRKWSELTKRILWSETEILNATFGQNILEVHIPETQECIYSPGYYKWDFSNISERLFFAGFFIGHEMCDDGNPCIVYFCEKNNEYKTCLAEDKYARPFVDIETDRWGWVGNKRRYPILTDQEEILNVLDFYERVRKSRHKRWKHQGPEYTAELTISSEIKVLREFLKANDLLPHSIKHE